MENRRTWAFRPENVLLVDQFYSDLNRRDLVEDIDPLKHVISALARMSQGAIEVGEASSEIPANIPGRYLLAETGSNQITLSIRIGKSIFTINAVLIRGDAKFLLSCDSIPPRNGEGVYELVVSDDGIDTEEIYYLREHILKQIIIAHNPEFSAIADISVELLSRLVNQPNSPIACTVSPKDNTVELKFYNGYDALCVTLTSDNGNVFVHLSPYADIYSKQVPLEDGAVAIAARDKRTQYDNLISDLVHRVEKSVLNR